ncbi:DUF4255 domain-containing protein [Pedobacter sp. MC2016-05]|uniref:DUF4255 domain-containing protein n=1 Tax=Pedobacter sp. MC2016-05 TaxID=2994474 RepID=UPI002246F8FF|nr:DUF4255 domain-containing protein [Pedobacter sp. MC2016-05]MCX2476536.1 DUF4255 domain-containing protein [Pedobacter sp. MC2016-05]
MINTALDFISKEINGYFNHLIGTTNEDYIVVSNLVYDGKLAIPHQSLGLTLINIEEDLIAKNQFVTVRNMPGESESRNPGMGLSLYILISANFHYEATITPRTDYLEGLERLSQVISFFQNKNVFTPSNSPQSSIIDSNTEQLSIALVNLNFEQINHLWSAIGHSYLPSVMYKLRMSSV